jgi:tetratricopeptide (TPR) repeat protein
MAETSPYPGSPSLSSEAREKVRQTFRHTIQLARSGRNEEALLGCDFILKMDARFQPARRLLETLRGVATGTVVDLAPFAEFVDGAPPAAAASAPAPPASAPAVSALDVPPPRPSAAPPKPSGAAASLDDLAFDDFAMSEPALSAPGPGSARPGPLPPPRPAPPAPPSAARVPAAAPPRSEAPPFDGDFSIAEVPERGGSGDASPFATQHATGAPPPFEAPPPAEPVAGGAVDPRISQFLRQGDEALSRGQVQEAIDLWSRVFLIDLSNEEASQRIDAAREKQAESARRIDMLLSEGIHQYDSGDFAGARSKFLDVLALSESDSTARNYLNQIDASIAERSGPIAPPAGAEAPRLDLGGAPSYGSEQSYLHEEPGSAHELAAAPGFEEAPITPAPEMPSRRTLRVDARVFLALGLLVLVAVGAGAYFFLKKRQAPVAPAPSPASKPPGTAAPASEDVIARANALLEQGKVEEARTLVTAIPDSDPRYPAALEVMERIRSAAVPTPAGAAPAVSAASLDEMRISGLAAARSSHYLDAVKALDPVVKAHPEDAEAAGILAKAREQVAAMGSAVKAYNEQDFQTAIKLFWDLRRRDMKNQDVEDFLFRSYFNDAIQDLQAGNSAKAAESFKEAAALRPGDSEAQRHLKFVKKYQKGATDLLSRIYIKHLSPRG